MQKYFNCHNHTDVSNIRLLDCINKPEALIRKAAELGLSGIAITDHECISSWVKAKNYEKVIREEYPEFKVALGNEIYLTNDRFSGQKYYHFILIAKDELGAKALRELSSTAWYNVYVDRRLERVPTLKSELEEVIGRYKGHVIATTACIGGELSSKALLMHNCREVNDNVNAEKYYKEIEEFIDFCLKVFGDDFYIECAPSTQIDQINVNRNLYNIAKYYNIPIVVATDSHYLTKNERSIHKAYLNSKEGDREVDSFYEFTYLMDIEEITTLLGYSFDNNDIIQEILNNTLLIQDKIQDFDLNRKQIIPKVKVTDYKKGFVPYDWGDTYPVLTSLIWSDNIQERYWVNECLKGLRKQKAFENDDTINQEDLKIYLERLETEANVIKTIGEKLDDCLFAYFNTFQHYIDLFWECGSIVGPGRGSATGFLSNYLLGITQLDPIRWELPYWRSNLRLPYQVTDRKKFREPYYSRVCA